MKAYSLQRASRKGLSLLLAGVLAFSLMGTAPATALAAEEAPADTPAATPDETVPSVQPVKPVEPVKPAKPLAFKSATVTKTIGAKKFTNKLVKDKKVKDKLTYTSSNKKVATVNAKGKVTVTGIGSTTIKVKSKATKGVKAASAKYTLTVNPKATSIRKALGAVGGFSVNWKAGNKKQVSGYQVRYAEAKDMKGAKTVSAGKSTTFKLITGLKDGATYYVQVRTYAKAKGKKYYSAWSKTKAVTTGVNSGDEELDAIVKTVLTKKVGTKGTPEQRLKKAFKHVANVKTYPYIRTNDTPKGNWSVSYAKDLYQTPGGNCYRYAALFCWLARGLGYDATAVTGSVPSRSRGQAPHGWVEVKLDGKTYIYDPEMQHVLKGFDLFKMTYKSAPMKYKKAKKQ